MVDKSPIPKKRPDESKPKFVDAVYRGDNGSVLTSPDENNPVTMLGLTEGDTFRQDPSSDYNARGLYFTRSEEAEGGPALRGGDTKIYPSGGPNTEPFQVGDVVLFGEKGLNPQTAAHEFMHRGFEKLRTDYTPAQVSERFGEDVADLLYADRPVYEHALLQGVFEREGVTSFNTYYEDLDDDSQDRLDRTVSAVYELANESLGERGFQTDRDRGPTTRPKRNVPEPSFFQKIKKLIGFNEGGLVEDEQMQEVFGLPQEELFTPTFESSEPETDSERVDRVLGRRPGFRSFDEARGQVSQEELEAGLDNAASVLVPFYDSGVNIVNVLQEYQKPEEERNYVYIEEELGKAGESAAVEGAMMIAGGVAGKYGGQAIGRLIDKVNEYEFDPNTMSAFGVGSIRKKAPEVNRQMANEEYAQRWSSFDEAETPEDWQKQVKKYVSEERDVSPTIRTPELEDSTRQLLENKITREEHLANVDRYKPVNPWDSLPREPSDKATVFSLKPNQRQDGFFILSDEAAQGLGVNVSPLKVGDMFNGRLDIPAYNAHDTWIVAGTSPAVKSASGGSATTYAKAIHYTGKEGKPVKFIASPKTSEAIGKGEAGKTGYATVSGFVKDLDPDAIREQAVKYLDDPDWVQVGFDPRRQGGFYVRAGDNKHVPVREAEEVIQIGPLVLAKKPKLDFEHTGYNEGGLAVDDQMQGMFKSTRTGYAEGGEVGAVEGATVGVDPVSGNEVPAGSMPEEVRDDIPAMLSEGEYVVPADVVRFFGVKFFEDLRADAKMGLQEMESNGRIGGEPVDGSGEEDLSAEEMDDLDMLLMQFAEEGSLNITEEEDEEDQGFAVGGVVEPMGGEPTGADALVERVMSAVKTNPAMQQELASKGIQISRTTPQMQPEEMSQVNPPQTGTQGFAEGGVTIPSMTEEAITSPSTVPSQFQVLGGSYFQPQAPVSQPTPVCPPGQRYDSVKKMCVPIDQGIAQQPTPTPSNDDDGGPDIVPQPTGTGEGGGFAGGIGWADDVDWADPQGWIKENITPSGDFSKNVAGTVGSLVSGPAGVAISALPAMNDLRNVAKMRAMQKVYEAAGMEDEAALIGSQVDKYVKSSPKLVDRLDDFLASGEGGYEAILKKNGIDPENPDPAAVRKIVQSGGGTAGTPKPTPKPKTTTSSSSGSSRNTQDFHKKIREDAAARKAKAEASVQSVKDEAARTGKSIAEVGRERAPSTAKTSNVGSGSGGTATMNDSVSAKDESDPRNQNKGGLMTKKKKKK
jgi:hypothetical protein